MSDLKVNIDENLASRLILIQFPEWSSLPIIPVEIGGNDNRTFRLGDEMVIRLPSAECYASQVEKEHYYLPKLAQYLPLSISTPLAMGAPDESYPWNWSVYKWIEGNSATHSQITNLSQFAADLARFLVDLQKIDSADGPMPGLHNFFRGGLLEVYDPEMRSAIEKLEDKDIAAAVTEIWETSFKTMWHGDPVWFHGDVSSSNLLVRDGKLAAVIDFGQLGIGDPACDLMITWSFFSGESREIFRSMFEFDDATWDRARGWALWKELCHPVNPEDSSRIVREIIADN